MRRVLKRVYLEKGRDYEEVVVLLSFEQNPQGGRPRTGFLLSLDAAKHIAMMSKGSVAHAIRE